MRHCTTCFPPLADIIKTKPLRKEEAGFAMYCHVTNAESLRTSIPSCLGVQQDQCRAREQIHIIPPSDLMCLGEYDEVSYQILTLI